MKTFTIGRSNNNMIILNYPQVSGNHADIVIDDFGNIRLIDHSTNGTSVNGILIHNQSIDIRQGDTVLFANYVPFDWNRITISNIPQQPIIQVQPQNSFYIEEKATGLLVAAWIFAALGGLLGVIFGLIVACKKVTLSNGERVYKYVSNHRTQGVIAAIISFVLFFFWMGI